MLNTRITRRQFIKAAAASGAMIAVGGGLFGLLRARPAETNTRGREGEVPKLVPTVCGMCDVGCGVLAYVQGNRLLKIEGNYNHSQSLGRICPRGAAGVKLQYSRQRLRSPLKRVGDRKFSPISWEQALTEIGAKLKSFKHNYGAESLAWLHHPHLSDMWDQQFMRAFGSPNIFTQAAKHESSRKRACEFTLGGTPIPDFANSRYILIMGYDPAEDMFVRRLGALMEAKEKGAHLVICDPRMGPTATQAHEWLPIRPGTEGALLMALIHVVIREELYDSGFVSHHTLGFEELRSAASDTTPAWASLITGIPTANIEALAWGLSLARPSSIVDTGFQGPSYELYANTLQASRAALALNTLMGNYGAMGGLLMSPATVGGEFRLPPTPSIDRERADGAGSATYPLATQSAGMAQLLPDVILSEQPYPIRALIVNHHNPALSLPDSKRVRRALQKLDLLVAIDVQGTETTDLAHYILPESTYLERYDPVSISKSPVYELALRQPVVERMYDTRAAHEVIDGLAQATGLGEYFGFTVHDVLKSQIAVTGMSFDHMAQVGVWRNTESADYGAPTFRTPSGKIELHSESLKAAGVNPLPAYQPPRVQPSSNSFRLLHGREALHTGTSTQNNPWLNALSSRNALWLNRARADRLGIADGSTVRVSSNAGQLEVRVRVTECIHPEAVFLVHGYGHTASMQRLSNGKGANPNSVIAAQAEPLTGTMSLNETIVTVEQA